LKFGARDDFMTDSVMVYRWTIWIISLCKNPRLGLEQFHVVLF